MDYFDSFIILRPDCIIGRKSKTKFSILINEVNETLTVDDNTGNILEQLLPQLDGTRKVKHIVKNLSSKNNVVVKQDLNKVIDNLFKWGLLSESNSGNLKYLSQINYFSSFSSFPDKIQKMLEIKKIGIIGGDPYHSALLDSFNSAGIDQVKIFKYSDKIKEPDKVIIDLPDYINSESNNRKHEEKNEVVETEITFGSVSDSSLKNTDHFAGLDLILVIGNTLSKIDVKSINKNSNKYNTKLLYAAFEHDGILLGPYIYPNQSSCLGCLSKRILENDPNLIIVEKKNLSNNDTISNDLVGMNPFLYAYLNILVGYACTHLVDISKILVNYQIDININRAIIKRYYILKSPRCPVCGNNSE